MSTPWLTNLELANALLETTTRLCLYRLNDLCWGKCPVRSFCQPETWGAILVADGQLFLQGPKSSRLAFLEKFLRDLADHLDKVRPGDSLDLNGLKKLLAAALERSSTNHLPSFVQFLEGLEFP